MKKILLLLAILFCTNSFSQEITYKEYSYSELFKMIEEEKDTIFKLKNAIVKYNEKTDSLFSVDGYDYVKETFKNLSRKKELIIDKQLLLDNVQLLSKISYNATKCHGVIHNVRFKKKIDFKNMINGYFYNCVFEDKLSSSAGKKSLDILRVLGDLNFNFSINSSKLYEQVEIHYMFMDVKRISNSVYLSNNNFYLKNKKDDYDVYLFARNISNFNLSNNTFHNTGTVHYRAIENSFHNVSENMFENSYLDMFISNTSGFDRIEIQNNSFNKSTFFEIDNLSSNYTIPIKQFSKGIISGNAFVNYQRFYKNDFVNTYNDSIISDFKAFEIHTESVYDDSKSFKGKLFNFYKSKFDNDDANVIYTEIKDLETERLKFLYNQNPSFEGFFTWKINQFLKVFSAYGTKPAKAVVFSMWVILLFAFIYLLFPNSWDAHGRKRIMNRYAFFFTYMNKKAGIHEVYLDHQKEDLLEFDEFKTLVEQQGKTVPKFFTATALPLYKWAISGTKFSSTILKRFDIMKGTWNEVPKKKRIWKSVLLIGTFLIAICYDIIIKMLNALMLSINTFTTLGFGEIPIKGLPRYLAIIQGFIGWFMLTIFSVSLISQLLN